MPTPDELVRLLAFPNESLTVEYKSWLVLSENSGRATLAKAAIALVNHGGGIVVLGMRENGAEGGALSSQPRSEGAARYSQDDVNAAINRYAEPPFHCELSFADHPETGIEHAFVSVPGGMATPVMSTRDRPGIIAARRCYIRKPGPRSEEPFTAEEWRTLLDRCVRAGREDMLDAIRLIVQGHAGVPPAAEARGQLLEFVSDARQRWQDLVDPLPAGDGAKMEHGHYELGFEIMGVAPTASATELRRRMDDAGTVDHSGWGPFVSIGRAPLAPRVVNGLIEAWLGEPEEGGRTRTPEVSDFWRAHPDGRLFLLRGYHEDGLARFEPGACIDVALPIRRVGEAMLYVARLARHFAGDPSIIVRSRYTGLHDRVLASVTGHRMMRSVRQCVDEEATMETQVTAAEIDDNLAEVLHPFLVPLYERFSFFELPMAMVVEEIEQLTRNRF